jgi:hypothetical protein
MRLEGFGKLKKSTSSGIRTGDLNIKTDVTEIGWDGMDWIDLDQDRNALVSTVMNLRVP